jgi:LysM repeat protein
MSSKRGIPKVAGVVLVCVGVAVSVAIVVMTLSTMGTMRDNAVKARGASTPATTVSAPATTDAVTEATTEAATNDVPGTPSTPSDAPTTTVSEPKTESGVSDGNEQQVVVESDDTLSGLSREYGRSVDAIANHNGIRDVNLIYDGSVLVIPESCDGY